MKDQNYAAMSEHAHVDGVYPFPAVMQTRRIETNGASIHVRVGGHGPAVVMLHGFGTTGDMWGHLASALIEDHMIVALDLRGSGLSSKPDGGYDKKNQAADVVGVLDALGVRTAELVTHDIGIMVGFAVAATHSERVSRWVASDAPALCGALCATRSNASGVCPVPGVQPGCGRQQDVPCAGQPSDAGLGLGWRSYIRPYDRRGDAVYRR